MNTSSAGRCKKLTPAVRRGLQNISAFCEVNAYEDSELYPRGERKLERDTDAALRWIDALISADGDVK